MGILRMASEGEWLKPICPLPKAWSWVAARENSISDPCLWSIALFGSKYTQGSPGGNKVSAGCPGFLFSPFFLFFSFFLTPLLFFPFFTWKLLFSPFFKRFSLSTRANGPKLQLNAKNFSRFARNYHYISYTPRLFIARTYCSSQLYLFSVPPRVTCWNSDFYLIFVTIYR